MSFPFGLGTGIGGGPSIMGMRRLLKRLLPSGYAEGGALLEELECWAAMLYDAHALPQRIASEAFVSLTSELLDEWEREYGLPNDAARTPAERQTRLVAAERAIGGAIRSRVESVIREISASAEWRTTTQLDLFYDDLTTWPSMIRQHAVELDEAEWAKPAVRRAIARVLQRMTGASGHFQHGYTDPAEAVVARTDAEWGSADHVIGRDAIRRGATSLDIARYEQVATLRRFGPLSKIRAVDLNEIQDATVYRRVTDGAELDALPGVQADRIGLSFAAECAIGPSVTVIDEGEDWRYRLATVWIAVASDDIRPGGASDANVGTTTQVRQLWYAGAGSTDAGAAANAYAITLATNVYLYADSTTGALKIRNEAAGTRYAVGMIHATGPSNNAALRDDTRLVTFVDGATFADAGLDAAFHTAWKRAGWTRMGEGTVDVDAWADRAGDGGAFIVAVIPAVLPGDTKVIDSYRDWRDRLIAVTCTSIQLDSWTLTEDDPAWPGSSRFDQLQVHPDAADAETDQDHTSLAYTRLGNANGDTIAGTMCALEAEARVWVDSTTGLLKLTRDADDAQTLPECYLLLIHATEQLGEHSTPDTLETLAVSDGDLIHPQELTQPQERSLCVQAVGYPGTAQAASSSLPLGPVAPPTRPTLPEMWESESGTRPFSQQVAGWARVYFSGVVPADSGELVLDATRDWRDRFLWASVAHSTTLARTLGDTQDYGVNSASGTTRLSAARYTGDGADSIWTDTGDNPYSLDVAGTGYGARIVSGDDSNVVTVYARESDGALCIASTRSADLAVTAMVEATFQLGLRPSR